MNVGPGSASNQAIFDYPPDALGDRPKAIEWPPVRDVHGTEWKGSKYARAFANAWACDCQKQRAMASRCASSWEAAQLP